MARAAVDSDSDGVSDFDELKRGTDPNSSSATGPAQRLAYGCGGDAVPELEGALAVLVLSLRRARR